MIVCSCSGVTDRDIRQAIAWMRASDPYALITLTAPACSSTSGYLSGWFRRLPRR
jgi:bacterioferritin-associated ferredoxin